MSSRPTSVDQPQGDRAVSAPSAPGLARLHLVTPELPSPITIEILERVLAAVPALVQVRTKGVDDRSRLAFAREVLAICRIAGAPCLINDRVDIALATEADGVHLGDEDLPLGEARRLLGPSALIGATCRDPEAARAATAEGADYLGVGPCFRSVTKPGTVEPLGPAGLGSVAAAAGVPIIAISGVTPDNAASLVARGAHGVAVVAAVFSAPDAVGAAAALDRSLPSLDPSEGQGAAS